MMQSNTPIKRDNWTSYRSITSLAKIFGSTSAAIGALANFIFESNLIRDQVQWLGNNFFGYWAPLVNIAGY